MNTLTLFLYVADVIPSVGRLVAIVGTLLTLILAITSVTHLLLTDTRHAEVKAWHLARMYKTIKLSWIPVLLLLLAALFPSTETLYLMAGSEVGEMVITSEEAKTIYGDIREVIRGYIPKED